MSIKVLDGRNSNRAPKVAEISSYLATEKYEDVINVNATRNIYCLRIDNAFVPCVSSDNKDYMYVLCGAYKTQRGFDNWLKKTFPNAKRVK